MIQLSNYSMKRWENQRVNTINHGTQKKMSFALDTLFVFYFLMILTNSNWFLSPLSNENVSPMEPLEVDDDATRRKRIKNLNSKQATSQTSSIIGTNKS